MELLSYIIIYVYLLRSTISLEVKEVMHSEQENSNIDNDDIKNDAWERKKVTVLPFLKKQHKHRKEKEIQYEGDTTTVEKKKSVHPNEVIFPMIYIQNHTKIMFKFSGNWYQWSTEKQSDGSKLTDYYVCYDDSNYCDDIGWERIDELPKCAFQINYSMPKDRVCINRFGVESHTGGTCDGAEQIEISEIIKTCGPRIRSLWRFIRLGTRPSTAAKPTDVNSLICENEEECFVTMEYRIHRKHITFSLHEPTRGKTFKSALKREVIADDQYPINRTKADAHLDRYKKIRPEEPRQKKLRSESKMVVEGKGVVKDVNVSGYTSRGRIKTKVNIRDDQSDELSE